MHILDKNKAFQNLSTIKDPVKNRQNLERSILLIMFITVIRGTTVYTTRLFPTYATVFPNLWHIISFKTTCKKLYKPKPVAHNLI